MKSDRLGPGFLKFGQVGSPREFGAQTTKTAIEPSSEDGDEKFALDGSSVRDDGADTYNLTGELAQDYDLTTSLLKWCKDNHKKVMPFAFRPDNAQDMAAVGFATIKALKVGGDVKARNNSEFSFAGVGDWELMDADTPAPDPWVAESPVTADDVVQLPTGEVLKAIGFGGNTGTTAPTAPGPGGTVTDGTVTWQRVPWLV